MEYVTWSCVNIEIYVAQPYVYISSSPTHQASLSNDNTTHTSIHDRGVQLNPSPPPSAYAYVYVCNLKLCYITLDRTALCARYRGMYII